MVPDHVRARCSCVLALCPCSLVRCGYVAADERSDLCECGHDASVHLRVGCSLGDCVCPEFIAEKHSGGSLAGMRIGALAELVDDRSVAFHRADEKLVRAEGSFAAATEAKRVAEGRHGVALAALNRLLSITPVEE